MQRKYIKAFNALNKMGVPVYEHADDNGNFSIDAEDPKAQQWANYYADPRMWAGSNTNPKMDKVLRDCGLFAEWVNPARLSVHQA